MNKVICDICGTSYPEKEECCPICGCTRDISAELLAEEEDFLKDSPIAAAKKVDGKFVSDPAVGLDTDPGDDDWEDDDYDDEEDFEDEEPSRGKTGVVILLVILIMILLAVTGFLFLRYLLPNMAEDTPAQTEAIVETETPVESTTEPGIPCEQLILMSGAALDLTREGEFRLINVIVKPADSTDELTYISADETVATVNTEGRVTAIGEGDTVITVFCGNQRVECRVFVRYMEETEPPTEQTTAPTEENEEETQADETEPEQETEPPVTEETTEPTEDKQLKDVTLKLGRTDISMGVGLQFTIPLDCDLSYEEIEWTTGNPNVATVKNGVITTHAQGTTQLTAKYGDQVVTCWIRVKF